ncbi:MAG: DUF2752 domain-containing protein [Planctomycetota bacterium]|nr:DUF2752 domain-containing protein [Planctomycetota bacterium]
MTESRKQRLDSIETPEMVESLADHEAESRELFGDGGRRLLVYHGLVAALCVVVVFFSVTMRSTGDQHVFLPGMSVPLPELCMTKTVLGIPCPGCGMTRGFISIAHGQWTRAWAFNPVSFLVFALVVGQIPWRFVQVMRILKKQTELNANVFFVPVLVMVLLLFAQWLIKMVT